MAYRTILIGQTPFVIENECEWCRDNLKRIRTGDLDDNEFVLFSPDLNASGKRMYWHIQIFDKSNPNVKDMKVKELY